VSFEQLSPDTVLYRTLTRASEFADGEPKASAFFRRTNDLKGLSVDYNVDVPGGCAPLLDPKSKRAILSLTVDAVAAGSLDVIPDTPTHANINTTIPVYDSLAPDERALQIAAFLLSVSTVVWRKPVAKP
jgi:hypothetical protein